MKAKSIVIFLGLCICFPCFSWGQEIVKAFQPTMNVYFHAGYQVSDSITRYFFTSSDSKYASHHFTYFIDHDLRVNSFSTRALLDPTEKFSALTDKYDLFHVGLTFGNYIL